MKATGTTTPWPVLLYLHANPDVPASQRDAGAKALDLSLMRRGMCAFTTKDYNRLFVTVLPACDAGVPSSVRSGPRKREDGQVAGRRERRKVAGEPDAVDARAAVGRLPLGVPVGGLLRPLHLQRDPGGAVDREDVGLPAGPGLLDQGGPPGGDRGGGDLDLRLQVLPATPAGRGLVPEVPQPPPGCPRTARQPAPRHQPERSGGPSLLPSRRSTRRRP